MEGESLAYTISLIGLLVLLSIQLLISEFYLKRHLKITPARKGLFSNGRHNVFIMIEVILVIIFIISSYFVIIHFNLSYYIRGLPILFFFLLLYFFRGLEEWMVRRDEKAYYHEWLGSIIFLIMILFVTIGELLSYWVF